VYTLNDSLLEAATPGVVTATWSVPVEVILVAGINDATPPVPIKMVAGRGLPFHSAAEHGDRLFPLIVSATGGPVSASSAALVGEMELITGVGRVEPVGRDVTKNGRDFEFVPGVPPETVIATPCGLLARKAVSAAVIAAVSCVALTKVVGRGEPFQLTTRPLANPVPVTVSVSPDKLQ